MTATETERVVCLECEYEDVLPSEEAEKAVAHHRAVTGHDIGAQEVEAQ